MFISLEDQRGKKVLINIFNITTITDYNGHADIGTVAGMSFVVKQTVAEVEAIIYTAIS